MQWSDHAKQRAMERFPGLTLYELELELLNARRMGHKTRKRLRKACPVAYRQYLSAGFTGRYVRISKAGTVFVVAASKPEVIVTLFTLA